MRLRAQTSDATRSKASSLVRAGCVGISVLLAGGAIAQAPVTTPGEAARVLEAKRKALEETESKAKALQNDVSDLDAERERLNARLVETGV